MKTLNEFLKEDKKVLKENSELKQVEKMLNQLNSSLYDANGHALNLSLYLDKIEKIAFPQLGKNNNFSEQDLSLLQKYRSLVDIIQDGLISIIDKRKKIK